LNLCSANIIRDISGSKNTPKDSKLKTPNVNNCDITAPKSIVIGPGPFGLGPWCGWSSGGGAFVVTVNKTKVYNIDFTYTELFGDVTGMAEIRKKGSQQRGAAPLKAKVLVDRLKGDTCTGPPWADDFNIFGTLTFHLTGAKP
jgi:hypothetical protein